MVMLYGVVAEWNTKDHLKREHSLTKPYIDDRWDFIGSTVATNDYVRLTPDQQSRKGGIWNNMPCMLRHWELHVHFKVHGQGKDLFGDGFAIWYTRDRLELGPVFGNRDYFSGLAIFLDTYPNVGGEHGHGHPYISAMVNNGSLHYDHDRDGTHTELAGCVSSFRKIEQEAYLAIRYEMNKLTVSTDIEGKNSWLQCFSVDGVRLPTGYYFGVSAATGDLTDNHDIVSLKLYDINVGHKDEEGVDYSKIQPSADHFAPPRDHVDDAPRTSIWKIVLGVFLVIIVLLCLVGAYVFYQSQTFSRKRFY